MRLSAGSLHKRESRPFHNKMRQVWSTAPRSKPRPAWLPALRFPRRTGNCVAYEFSVLKNSS